MASDESHFEACWICEPTLMPHDCHEDFWESEAYSVCVEGISSITWDLSVKVCGYWFPLRFCTWLGISAHVIHLSSLSFPPSSCSISNLEWKQTLPDFQGKVGKNRNVTLFSYSPEFLNYFKRRQVAKKCKTAGFTTWNRKMQFVSTLKVINISFLTA